MNTAIITTIAANHHIKGSIWAKNGNRFYINSCNITSIYNTNKCKQSVYIDLATFEVKCFTECPSQTYNWCKNENERIVTALKPLARLMRIAANSKNIA